MRVLIVFVLSDYAICYEYNALCNTCVSFYGKANVQYDGHRNPNGKHSCSP